MEVVYFVLVVTELVLFTIGGNDVGVICDYGACGIVTVLLVLVVVVVLVVLVVFGLVLLLRGRGPLGGGHGTLDRGKKKYWCKYRWKAMWIPFSSHEVFCNRVADQAQSICHVNNTGREREREKSSAFDIFFFLLLLSGVQLPSPGVRSVGLLPKQ